MRQGWLDRAGRFKIEHVECPHPGDHIDLSKPPTGIVHTIEGGLASGMGVFRQHYAPTFAVGPHRIIQCVPLGFMAAAVENHPGGVETNRIARVQIEVEGHSETRPYSFPVEIEETVAALMAELRVVAEIPLTHPFPDAMPPPPWATEKFSRRHAGLWGKKPGWYGHVEVPENEHWDPGALQWDRLFAKARGVPVANVVKPKPKVKRPKTHVLIQKAKRAPAPLHVVLRLGSKGPLVASVQRALQTLGAKVAADGTYGPTTKRAVSSFQHRSGLATDGIAGPATLRALRSAAPGVL